MARKELNENQVWKISSVDYVKAVVKKLEEWTKKKVRKLPARATTPM